MALSCAYRTGQRFGAAHLIDVLRGADNAKVRQFGHHTVSTYGIGSALDAARWRSVFRQLVAAGFLEADFDHFGALRITKAATPLLRGEHQLHLREDPSKRERTRRRNDTTASTNSALSADAEARFDTLRNWRSSTAREQNVPAYVIFHDATLRSIAQHHPHTLTALAAISGVGAGKLERYGEAVLGVLAAQ